jgi:lactobin A/cerein 7B family class IIb bacteriocin
MSEQTTRDKQNPMTPQELRERMLEELEAGKKAIADLSEEELEAVAGGGVPWKSIVKWGGRAFDVATLGGVAVGLGSAIKKNL